MKPSVIYKMQGKYFRKKPKKTEITTMTVSMFAWQAMLRGNGVLIALDSVLPVRKNMKKGQRPDFWDYQEAIAKRDNKMNRVLLNAYELLHKSLGYDGVTDYKVVQASLDTAKTILNWADKQYSSENHGFIISRGQQEN